ncbi:MAG: hypothetical protein H6719_07260 [Sandaracinaceae bacterium]|nr:hypothetical protein [Sandaracinaceae bacterium]
MKWLGVSLGLVLAACGPDTTWRPAWDATDGWVMNLGGLGADDLYAVGGSLERGRMIHFDGVTATPVELPDVPLVNWVQAFAANDVHAVGNEGTLLHFDGAAWTTQPSPTDQDLWGVWGSAPNDVWAVGGSARLASGVPTLLHYDGAAWTSVEVPPLTPTGVRALFKVWGSSATDVYAVGQIGVAIHWDGATWTEVRTGAGDDLVAVWGTGPNDVVAVGGRSNGVVARFDGTEWHSEFVTPLPGLNGVWMREPGVAHIAGLRGLLATYHADTGEIVEEDVAERLDFHALFGADGRLHAVGGNLAVPSSATGIAWRRDLGGDE